MDASDFLENALANHIFRGIAYPMPTELHVGLLITITDGDTATITEVTAASYARVAFGPSDTLWSDPALADGETANAFAVTFPKPVEDWGSVTGLAIYDQLGNVLIVKELLASKEVLAGNPAPEFNPGSLSVTFG